MVEIIQKENKLIVENYQNKISNLTWLDVVDNLELYGLFIRAKIDGTVKASYKGKKYIVDDSHIERMEQANRLELLLC